MKKEPVCQYRQVTPPKQANICLLGRFNGLVTDGMCRRCIRDGLNNEKNCAAGTELKNLIKKWLKIEPTESCACNDRARIMDLNGCEWCAQNIDIIVGWLREEALKRQLPFADIAGKILVKRAIANARREKQNER